VQSGILERAFHDALFPQLMFRGEAVPHKWPGNIGDTMTFTGKGLLTPDASPLVPGVDPSSSAPPYEQWTAQLQQYGKPSIDTFMPDSITAIASVFLSNAKTLGLAAAQAINRAVRDRMYNAGESGWTVTTNSYSGVSSIHVQRLNGFTTARNPALSTGSPVQFAPVSSTNPLNVLIFDNGAQTANTVIGFTPDNAGDAFGPGTLTLGSNVTSVLQRAYVISADRSDTVFVGGGLQVDSLTPASVPTFTDVRSVLTALRQNNVPRHPEGRFHCHLAPVSQARFYDTPEFQRLNTSLPDYYYYRQYALGELLGVLFLDNTECPVPATVVGGTTGTYDLRDPLGLELYTNGNATAGTPVYRALFSGQGGINEYYLDQEGLITQAGLNGQVGAFSITNNGIEVFSDRIKLIIRAPVDKLQQMVTMSWSLFADWPARTDAATGDAARFKRFVNLVHT
jgi:hypothetical protein